MFELLYCMTKGVFSYLISSPAVLVEWVQAAHLQGQDDPDHKVRNQGYKSEYVELTDEAGNRE